MYSKLLFFNLLKMNKLTIIVFFLVCLSCQNQTDTDENDDSSKKMDEQDTLFSKDDEIDDSFNDVDEIKRFITKCDSCDALLGGCAVRFKLKPQSRIGYLATEDPVFVDLVKKYNLTMYQTCWSPFPEKTTPELLLYYTLKTNDSISAENWEFIVNEFIATGKFENCVYEYEIVYIKDIII